MNKKKKDQPELCSETLSQKATKKTAYDRDVF
jgi:hypothetical protein